MKVNVFFFGATAEAAGSRLLEIEVEPNSTAKQVFDLILTTRPKLGAHRLLFAVNQEYSSGDEPITDGDELAIFTAVSGG
jgi:molybdopterin converting factor small subunit